MTDRVIASKTVYVDDIYDYVTSKKSEIIEDHQEVFLKAVSGGMVHNFIIRRLDTDNVQVFYISSLPLNGDE